MPGATSRPLRLAVLSQTPPPICRLVEPIRVMNVLQKVRRDHQWFLISVLLLALLMPLTEPAGATGLLRRARAEPAGVSAQSVCTLRPARGQQGQRLRVDIVLAPGDPNVDLIITLFLLFPLQEVLDATNLSFQPGGIQAVANDMALGQSEFVISAVFDIAPNAAPGPRRMTITVGPIMMVQAEVACPGAFTVTRGTIVSPDVGGTVTDPRTGAAIIIPAYTLKVEADVKVITLDSPQQIAQIDNTCGVDIQPEEPFPEVPGFVRASEVVRCEVQPCGTIIFGPGGRLVLPLDRARFPNGLPVDTTPPLRLFELARSGGRLVFLDTGIPVRVTDEQGRSPAMADFVTAPDIQVFGTFAAFMPALSQGVNESMSQRGNESMSQRGSESVGPFPHFPISPFLHEPIDPFATAQPPGDQLLYFPLINQSPGRQTRISIALPETTTSHVVTITGYTETGAIVGAQLLSIPPNGQVSLLVSDLFPRLTRGAIIARSPSAPMTGFLEIADNFQAPGLLAGVEAVRAPQRTLVFPIVKSLNGGMTEIRVFNSNASPVSLKLVGLTAAGSRINPTTMTGQPLSTITLPAFGSLVVSSQGSSTPNVRLDFANLDGGYVVVHTTDGRSVTGGEMFGEMISGQPTLALVNGLSFPTGCLPSVADPCTCQVDTTPESPVPSALQQHTLYAPYFEASPAVPTLFLVNVTDRPADVAFRVFSELGRFRRDVPQTGFMTIRPHQVFQMPDLIGFNPSPGYIVVMDQNSALVGGIINRNSVSGRFATIVPFIADDPQLTQTVTNTFFSRIQLNPPPANPPVTTGMLVFNPVNNPLEFVINIVNADGTVRPSPPQSVAPRGSFVRTQQSLSILFPNLNLNRGFAQVRVTTVPGPGMGGRVIPVAVYRSGAVVSTVSPQNK